MSEFTPTPKAREALSDALAFGPGRVDRIVAAGWVPGDEFARHVAAETDNVRAAYKIASDAADRFRDVVSEVVGRPGENPGDDVLVTELRAMHGKTGPEPTRWRDFLTGALATVDQINAAALSVEAPAETPCNCAPDESGVIVHNWWSHPEREDYG